MLTSKTAGNLLQTSLPIGELDLETLLQREWLLTNSRGGFSCGTVVGCNTRRYHGLLTGSKTALANRMVTLANCLEQITLADGSEWELANFEFQEGFILKGMDTLQTFHRSVGVHFDFVLPSLQVTRSVFLHPEYDTLAVVYDFHEVESPFHFTWRPLVAMRDFHALQHAARRMEQRPQARGFEMEQSDLHLTVWSPQMQYHTQENWWYDFKYRIEQQRGQDDREDLWSPGELCCHVEGPERLVIWASLQQNTEELAELDLDILIDSLTLRERDLTEHAKPDDKIERSLFSAAGQFVVEREVRGETFPTIVAGYPWFLDWGRDAFISLPGILLSTERIEDALRVLTTFGKAIDMGMVPNRFDDYTGKPHYNSVDASLWFVHAAFDFLASTGDEKVFVKKLLGFITEIVGAYYNGTRFGIHADEDGLLTGGSPDTQLTWMDAKCGEDVFTPRYGKCVEVNALWYSALRCLEEYCRNNFIESAEYYGDLAAMTGQSFRRLFWNEQGGCLYDCILPDGTPDASLRPNQIFAISLPWSPLLAEQQKKVVRVVEKQLLTPYGLRTLGREDGRYKARYEGGQYERDSAYHQGTVWPFLMGAFVEAYLKVHDFSKSSKTAARKMLTPLLEHLQTTGCIGSISEVFDGDEPHLPKGCFAQAWSVAEVLRAYQLVRS